jgi:arylsulfatase A-like enzyme
VAVDAGDMARPNVLLVIADQWRAQACGWSGNGDVLTPHFDGFARTAVEVHRAVSGVPVCTPARASLITGLRPDRHGLFVNDAALDPGLPTFGKQFAAAGYDTAWIGKWHVDGHGRYGVVPPERRQGFAYWRVCECTHDYFHSRYHGGPEERFWDGYDADAQTADLQAWLHRHDRSRPFLAVLSWGPPHNPYETAPAAWRERYDPARLAVPPTVRDGDAERVRRDLAGYYAHISALDAAFGRLDATLDALGLSEDTIVVVTSDHGDLIGCHGLWEKQGPWDEAIRIPFLIRGPGLPAGVRNGQMLDLIDLWPTLAGLAGLPAPAGVQGMDRSLHLRAGTVPPDDAALYASYHLFGTWSRDGAGDPLFAAREARGLRTARHTYVEDRDGAWLLYDNEADPWQQRNLVADPAYATLRQDLAAWLRRRLAEAEDDFVSGADLQARWRWPLLPNGNMPMPEWRG